MASSKLPDLSDFGRAGAGVPPHRCPAVSDRGVGTEGHGGLGSTEEGGGPRFHGCPEQCLGTGTVGTAGMKHSFGQRLPTG